MGSAATTARSIIGGLPVIRSRQLISPPYHIGGVLENRLGLQVLRVLGKSAVRAIRPRVNAGDAAPIVKEVEENGIAVIENFLSADEFEAVREEFERANDGLEFLPYKNIEGGKLYRRQITVANNANFNGIRRFFQTNPFLMQAAAGILRKKVNVPSITLDTYRLMNPDGFDNDIENVLHADLHTTTVKMFFYLDEVSADNGAFVFVRGSHKVSLSRLIHEYDLSVRQAKLKAGLRVPEELLAHRKGESRNIIRPSVLGRNGLHETQFVLRPNTLVIANNMGFHRRGEFSRDQPRKSILVNFRNSERVWL